MARTIRSTKQPRLYEYSLALLQRVAPRDTLKSMNEARMDNADSWVCISWAPTSRRSESFALALGGMLHNVYRPGFRPPFSAPIKYGLQAIRTARVLFRERPRAIHVQNPPFFCGLVVYGYCLVTGAKFVQDHHSAAFLQVWDWALPIQRFLARRAVTNIVTNQHWADTVQAWNAPTFLIGHPFLDLPQGKAFPVGPGFSVAFVSTYSSDEPLGKVLKAAAELPDIGFYVTGQPKGRFAHLLEKLPPNVTFTGFLPDDQYLGLLRAVGAVMALTTRDHTLQCGGYEAVSIGQPLITSDWPFLKDAFPRGTIYATNTVEGIRDAILAVRQAHEKLKIEMKEYQIAAKSRWDMEILRLNDLVETSFRQDRASLGG